MFMLLTAQQGSDITGGNFAVADDAAVGKIIGQKLDLIGDIASEDLQRGQLALLIDKHLRHNTDGADLTGIILAVDIQQDQIAGLRQVLVRLAEQLSGLQLFIIAFTACILRQPLHLCVVGTEGNEGGAPVYVGRTVPCTVPGIAHHRAILGQNHVLLTLTVVQLGFGNGQQVLAPAAGELHILKGGLPVLCRFHVRLRIVIRNLTGNIVNVLGNGTDQGTGCIVAAFCVLVGTTVTKEFLLCRR